MACVVALKIRACLRAWIVTVSFRWQNSVRGHHGAVTEGQPGKHRSPVPPIPRSLVSPIFVPVPQTAGKHGKHRGKHRQENPALGSRRTPTGSFPVSPSNGGEPQLERGEPQLGRNERTKHDGRNHASRGGTKEDAWKTKRRDEGRRGVVKRRERRRGEEAKRVDAVECLPPDDVLGRAARRRKETGLLASNAWETYGGGRGSKA